MDFLPQIYGPYGPNYMDFLLEIYGPYGPYMDFLLENIAREIQKCSFEKKIDRRCPNSEVYRKIQNFKMAISTCSAVQIPKFRVFSFFCGGGGGPLLTGSGGYTNLFSTAPAAHCLLLEVGLNFYI